MATVDPKATPKRSRSIFRRGLGGQYVALVGGVVAVAILMSVLTPFFFQADNLVNIGIAVSFTGIVAAITTAVLISGGLDLSIAAVMALSTSIVAVSLHAGVPWPVAILLGVLSGAVSGAINGYVISYVGVNAFVVTVATQFLLRGVAYLITGGVVIAVTNPVVVYLGQGKIFGVPLSLLVMIIIFVLVGWLLHATVLGRHWYAIGGSPGGNKARLAGIPVAWRRMQVYILSGLAAGIAGVLLAGYTTVGDANAEFGAELSILAAVILGGTALAGGRGTIIGTAIGVVLIGIINNGIQLLNLGIAAQYIFLGAILLLAVIFDQVKNRREKR